MKIRVAPLSLFLFFILTCRVWAGNSQFSLASSDRLLVIAPHPDDETIGAGGLIQRALQSHAAVKVLYLTNGDYNEIASIFYQKKPLLTKKDFIKSGQIRNREAVNAMGVLGLRGEDLIFLGYPDFGTLTIWKKYWGGTEPFRSLLTQIHQVPYKEDLSFGNEYKAENIVRDFENVILSFQPTMVLVTPPFDLHPDHQAAYLYLQVALLHLHEKGLDPVVYAYPVHAHHWPAPKKYFPTASLMPPTFLLSNPEIKIIYQSLTKGETEKKKQALQKYESQMAYSKKFLFSFVRSNEFFLKIPVETIATQRAERSVDIRATEDDLLMDIRLENPLDALTDLKVSIFSYKNGVSFGSLPKLSMRFSRDRLSVSDGPRRLRNVNIHYEVKKSRVTIRVPMRLLKNPDAIFTSVQSAIEQEPIEFNAWKLFQITGDKKETQG